MILHDCLMRVKGQLLHQQKVINYPARHAELVSAPHKNPAT
jgi:hypothetical protein